jgi:dienelactone hydrolase
VKKILIGLLVFIILLSLGAVIYIKDYYEASDYVHALMEENSSRITSEGQYTSIRPKEVFEEPIGIIFYPGGKVEAIAYMPLLMQLADQGVRPVLVEMPGNLAVLDINAAEDVFGMYQEIEHWYIAGHSLGGAMASQYMEKNHDKVEGLILLGAYPVNNAPVDTLVIYGTHDLLLDLEQVAKADQVYEIKDGNHAYFGDYGEQEGDGKARISREQQQEETVNRIMEFIENIS